MKKSRTIHIIQNTALMLILLLVATSAGILIRRLGFHETNVVVFYMLAVLLTARFTDGYAYGMEASLLSILLFNWFFTEPYFSLKVTNSLYILTFLTMAVTAILTSALTTKVKETAAESSALYQMTNHLTDAEDVETIYGIMIHTISEILSCEAACIGFDEQGNPEDTFLQQMGDGRLIRRELEDGAGLKKRMLELEDFYGIGEEFYELPVRGTKSLLAVLLIPRTVREITTGRRSGMLHSLIESSSLALERFRSLQAQARSREEMAQERFRGNLLRAISHDLRTPLSGIMGTTEMLMDMTDQEDPRYEMEVNIYKDVDWLHGLVENILNLTKIQDGRLSLEKEPEAVEEVVGAALKVMKKRLPGRKILVSIPDNLLFVPMDPRLITQVLVNLLDNAAKHTTENQEISIQVMGQEWEGTVAFSVADRGSGIAEKDLPNIFQMFYTTHGKDTSTKRGVGLGLSICQSIIEAHGGTITARNREGGGAEFTFILPLGGDAHAAAGTEDSDCGR